MLTALFTLLTGTTADPLAGMTGEITLRGLVLPVGAVKEKLLAAHRAGLKKVILPARNERDLHEVPDETRAALQLVFAEQVEDVLLAAVPALKLATLAKARRKTRKRSSRKKSKSSRKTQSTRTRASAKKPRAAARSGKQGTARRKAITSGQAARMRRG